MTYFRNLFVQSCVSVLQVSADLDLRLDLRFQAVCSASISIHVLERTLILLWDKIMGTYLLLWLYVLPSMTDLMKSWAQLIIMRRCLKLRWRVRRRTWSFSLIWFRNSLLSLHVVSRRSVTASNSFLWNCLVSFNSDSSRDIVLSYFA